MARKPGRKTMRVKKQRGGAPRTYADAPYIVKIEEYMSLPQIEKTYYTYPQAYYVKVSEDDARKSKHVLSLLTSKPGFLISESDYIIHIPDSEKPKWGFAGTKEVTPNTGGPSVATKMYARLPEAPQAQAPQAQASQVYQYPQVYQPQAPQQQRPTYYVTQQPYYPYPTLTRQRKSRKN